MNFGGGNNFGGGGGFNQNGGFQQQNNGGNSRGRGRGRGRGGRGRGRGRGRGGGSGGIRFANDVAKFDRAVAAHVAPNRAGVKAVCASSENSTVFTGGLDGLVKMFNLGDGSATEQQEGAEVSALCFYANWLFVGFLQQVPNNQLVGFVKGYNFGTNPVKNFNLEIDSSFPAAHRARVTSICVAGEILFTGGEDGAVRGWKLDGAAWKLVGSLGGDLAHNAPVHKVEFINNHLFTAAKGEIKIWDMKGQCLSTFQAHQDEITGICGWTKDTQNVLLTSSTDATIKVWDLSTTNVIQQGAVPIFTYPPPQVPKKPKAITSMLTHVMSNGMHILIIGTIDGSLQALDLPDFNDRGFLSGHDRSSSISSLTIVQPQNLLFAGNLAGQLNCFTLL
mmetsp:Transcript_17241/g.30389  ORF Transcript_17241/g.30389 Transcript_17241/m.30389 type:complete len:391 (+) Transcript_17241:292-1464(+)